MAYANETDIFKIPWWETGEQSDGDSNEDAALGVEWPLALILESLAGPDLDCTLYSGFAVSIGAGLSVNVAAGKGAVGGLVIYASGITNKASLPDESTVYIYLKITATTKRDRTFTVEASLSGGGMADAILIASCTTTGGAVTAVDNDPTGRAPRLPASVPGIPGLRVVAPAGAEYTSPKTAIEACNAGDVVILTASTYTCAELITFPADNITLLGANRDGVILDFTSDAGDCIDLNGKSCLDLAHFTLQTVAGKTGIGIYGSGCDDLIIRDVKFSAAALTNAVRILSSNRVRISHCLFALGYTGEKYAIYLDACDQSRIAQNTINCTGATPYRALYVVNTDYAYILHNTLSFATADANLRAVYVRALSDNVNVGSVVAGNIFAGNADNGDAIVLGSPGDPHFLDETMVTGNSCFDFARGIWVACAAIRETLIHGNKVATCTTGVSDAGTNTNALDQD